MHSFWQRLNAIFFYTLSVLGFLAFAAAGSTYWHGAEPRVSVSLKKLMLRKIQGAGHDQAIISLQIDADLRSIFNWNVKQLFVYVTAEYETDANVCTALPQYTAHSPRCALQLAHLMPHSAVALMLICPSPLCAPPARRRSTRWSCGTRSSLSHSMRGSAPALSPISAQHARHRGAHRRPCTSCCGLLSPAYHRWHANLPPPASLSCSAQILVDGPGLRPAR